MSEVTIKLRNISMIKHSTVIMKLPVIALVFSCLFTNVVSAETFIVSAKNTNFNIMDNKAAVKLWMGKKKRLNGQKVVIVDQQEGTIAQIDFYQKVLKKSPKEMKAYWAKLVFMGNSFPPRKLKDDKKVIAWVIAHPNSIGYIDASAIDNSVKILLTVK